MDYTRTGMIHVHDATVLRIGLMLIRLFIVTWFAIRLNYWKPDTAYRELENKSITSKAMQ